jgi:Raf kinase inhibitor-like YbhB/YbcL family protein
MQGEIAEGRPEKGERMSLTLESAAFEDGGWIPQAHGYDGGDVSPPLQWEGAPARTKAMALIVEDRDASNASFVHWLAYNIPASQNRFEAGVEHRGDKTDGTLQGRNDFDEVGYGGPKPPPGTKRRYSFTLYALDAPLDLEPGADKASLEEAMQGHVLDKAELRGRFVVGTGGEGNRVADRHYRQAATDHARSERASAAARDAKAALDSGEAEQLAEAEKRGKSRALGTHDQRGEP